MNIENDEILMSVLISYLTYELLKPSFPPTILKRDLFEHRPVISLGSAFLTE